MVNYAEDYGEYYPFDERGPLHSLALLYPDYLQDPKPFRCRIASARKGGANPLVSFPWDTPLAGIPCDYGYTWHTTYRNPEMMFAIVADMPQNHDAIKTRANRFNVLFFDTHVSSKRTPFCSSDPADNIFAREPGWSPDTDAYIRQTPD
jgi:prepilin-type processing-associated H-X9-DG protein